MPPVQPSTPAPLTVQDRVGNIYVNGTTIRVADVAGLPAKHPKSYKGQA